MAEWYEHLTDEQIAWLKENKAPAGLLADAEWELLSRVPFSLREYFSGSEWKPDLVCDFGKPAGLAYRLRPEWKRPKKTEWVFDDVKISAAGLRYPPGAPDPAYWNHPELQRRDDYGGVIWEWRRYKWAEDRHGNISWLVESYQADWGDWTYNPSVEQPKPIAVRFRREVVK